VLIFWNSGEIVAQLVLEIGNEMQEQSFPIASTELISVEFQIRAIEAEPY